MLSVCDFSCDFVILYVIFLWFQGRCTKKKSVNCPSSSVTYFAVRETAQHKLAQLKLGPTIYAIGTPVVR